MRMTILGLLLAGCSTGAKVETTCDASRWTEFVGQPEEAIYGVLGNLRVVHHGAAVEDGFNPDRLNAEIGQDGRVLGFGCY